MARNSILWLWLFIPLAFFVRTSEQFEDPLQRHIFDNDHEKHDLSDAEIEEILLKYDKNGDGELSAEEMSKYFRDAMAALKGENSDDKPDEKPGKGSTKKRSAKQKSQTKTKPSAANGSTWSGKQIVGGLLGILCLIIVFAAVVQWRNGTANHAGVDVEDVRAARLRKLASEQHISSAENSPLKHRNERTPVNKSTVASSDKQTVRRRLNDKSEVWKGNTGEAGASGTGKRSDKSRLLNPSIKQTDDCKPKLFNVTARTLAATEVAAASVRATTSEKCPVTTAIEVNSVPRMAVADNLDVIDAADVQKELSTTSSRKPTVTKQEKLQDLPYEDVVKEVLMQVLECSFEYQVSKRDVLPLIKAGKEKGQAILQIEASELPVNSEELNKKLEKLLAKRIYREVDPMKFAILCFDRCSQLPGKKFNTIQDGGKIWKEVTSAVMEPCVNTVLKHLIHAAASPTGVEDDLWSDFVQSGQSEGPSQFFLASVGGWSCDGITVSADLLSRLLEKGKQDPEVKETFVEMVTVGGRQVVRVKRLDEITLECKCIFRGLETLLSQPTMAEFLAEALERELDSGIKELGVFFQHKSLFSSFLSTSTIEVKKDKKSRSVAIFLEMPHFPQPFRSDADQLQSQIMDGIHGCQNVVYKALVKLLKSNAKDSALAWLAGVVSLNDLRLSPNMPGDNFGGTVAGDGFMLNLCTVALQLCDSFLLSKGKGKYKQIEARYCTSKGCRLRFDNERTMGGGNIIGTENEEKTDLRSLLFPSGELKGQFKLMTEMFHITHSALHVGLTTTIQRYNKINRYYARMSEMKQGTPEEAEVRKQLVLFILQWNTCLHDTHFMTLCSEFYITSAAWLLHLLDSCAAENKDLSENEIRAKQREIFANIPEFYVKDMCSWFSFAAIHKPCALKGLDICVFVDCCCALIERRDLMPGPVAATRIVSALLSFAEICSRNKRKNKLLEATTWGSGIEGDLLACVSMCPAVRDKLGPALIHTYSSVDIVEGLDVDKEEFDKFSARFEIIKLLEILWNRPDCLPSILGECGQESFQSFLGCVLDTLLFVLKDGLLRITNVKKVQCAKQCDEKWKELSLEQRKEKEQFLKGEEQASQSHMYMANATLALLEKITQEEKVARCFSRSPLSIRAAAAIIGFLDQLCGRKSVDLKVQNMEKYSFDPRDLLVKILTVLVRMSNASEDREFVKCLAANPDYSRLSVERALQVVQRENLAPDHMVQDLRSLMQEVSTLLAQDEDHPSPDEDESDVDETELPPLVEVSEEGGEEAGSSEPCDAKQADQAYIDALEPIKFDTAELVECHAFRCRASQPICPRSGKVKALMREATQLKNNLPIYPNASILVRQDENRMDFVRALITGTVDTPYSRGCFVFDVYFPSSYPVDPPLVKIITTGNGTVRFNPNLYADGKVCLSLLGTFHGRDSSEKWDPKKSSLYQVLVSIQSMMFTPDPCFNEPGYEGIKGTDEGDTLCKEYNAKLRLHTIRHAMVGQLREPTPGFEEAIRAHFRLQREAVLKQCAEWLAECADAEEERRMRKAVDTLKNELDKL
ncbi:hypothetical protein ACROYT_G012589 [Oculina patagonica]